MNKCVSTACWLYFCCLCVFAFRAGYFVLDNQLGDLSLGEASFFLSQHSFAYRFLRRRQTPWGFTFLCYHCPLVLSLLGFGFAAIFKRGSLTEDFLVFWLLQAAIYLPTHPSVYQSSLSGARKCTLREHVTFVFTDLGYIAQNNLF